MLKASTMTTFFFEIHFITGPNDFVPILAGAKRVAAALNVHYIV